MNRQHLALITLSLASAMMLMGNTEAGCGGGLDNRPGEPGVNVGGNEGADWDVTYDKTMEVRIKNAGGVLATHNIAVGGAGTFELDGVTLDLTKLCAREDVACPHEVFPGQVRMTQPGSKLHLLYVSFNKEGPLKEVTDATLLGNVDSDHDFSIALGVGAAVGGPCGLLSVSYATGHINSDSGDPPMGTTLDGQVRTAYSGGCMLLGSQGGAAAGLTVELRVPFRAVRK